MESIGKVFILGTYKYGSIHTDKFSIRVYSPLPDTDTPKMYTGQLWLDSLHRPYLMDCSQVADGYSESFISVLLRPSKHNCDIEVVTLHDGQSITVDFTATPDKLPGFYSCDLEVREDRWIFITKGVDILVQH